MKKNILFSLTITSLLFSVSPLSADSVAKKEASALANPKMTFGNSAAKAQIQEAQSKLMFESKMDAQKFQEEALKDKSKQINYSITKEAAIEQKSFKNAPKEIYEGLNKTLEAISAIQKKDIEGAKESLKTATKEFDKALKDNPDLKLVPIANEIEVKSFGGDVALIKKSIKTAKELLDEGDLQTARAILQPLEDEMVISTQLIPMDIYPMATKEALKALESKDELKALAILSSGLSAMAIDTVVIPISLLSAQDLVIAASKIDKSKKTEATALLDIAQQELEKAVVLGYTKKHSAEYKSIIEEIKAIKKEIKGKNVIEILYDHIEKSFEKLLGLTRKDVKQNRAEAKVNSYEKNESKKALKESKEFKKDSKEDEKKTIK